jgi:(R,R)-butanediol dehydrogenase/meso-butanediol dehydrogenase/diacetyl reductase
MLVASYLRARTMAVDDRPAAPPRAGQVQIAVDYVGLCGADVQIYRGELDSRVGPAAILGHEVSGHVAFVGAGVTTVEIGQRVTVMPLSWCSSCPACSAGHEHLCHRLSLMGIDSPGGLQRSWNVPADVVVPVPDAIAAEWVVLAEPAAIAVHALRALQQAPIAAGDHVLVVDSGPVALFIALLARHAGAEVAVVERERHRRVVGRTAGFTMLDPAVDPVASYVQTWTRASGVDIAFEVSGESLGVDMAVSALAPRGRLVLVGGHDAPREVNLNRVVRRELRVLGASRYEHADFAEAVELLAADWVPLELFVSSTESIDRVDDAFAALDAGGVMKIVVDLRHERH